MGVIDVEHLTKHYHGRTVVDDVSFTVEDGEIFTVVGPNGAGKTTIVESIEGLRRPDGGRVRVLGLDPLRDGRELHEQVGAQLQESQLPDRIKVWEALDLYSSFYRAPTSWPELMDRLGLAPHRDAEASKLSGGLRQRLSVALALVGEPRIAVLDELTTGLDPQARRDTWDLIEDVRARGVTIVLVTHFMEEAERLADRVALIDEGRLVALDTPAGLVRRAAAEQRIRFRPSEPIDDAALRSLPEVSGVTRDDAQVTVTGTGDVVHAVMALLARRRIIAEELRIEQPGLDDAFLSLTEHPDGTDRVAAVPNPSTEVR
jgi:ABC-2 type transport system ATP-binding protein